MLRGKREKDEGGRDIERVEEKGEGRKIIRLRKELFSCTKLILSWRPYTVHPAQQRRRISAVAKNADLKGLGHEMEFK